MSIIERTVVLTGVHAGKTINLRGIYPFEHGELTLVGPEEDVLCEVRSLKINFAAYVREERDPTSFAPQTDAKPLGEGNLNQENDDGKRDLQAREGESDGQAHVQSDVQPNGEGPGEEGAAVGDGAAGSEAGNAGLVPDGHRLEAKLILGEEDPAKAKHESEPAPTRNDKLLRAIQALDHATDAHWTKEGKPALAAVTALYGSTDVNRADIDALAPDLRRVAPKK